MAVGHKSRKEKRKKEFQTAKKKKVVNAYLLRA